MEGVLIVFHIRVDLFQDFHASHLQGTSYMYNLTKSTDPRKEQEKLESKTRPSLRVLCGLMWSQGDINHGCAPELGHHRKYDHSPPHEGRWHVRP